MHDIRQMAMVTEATLTQVKKNTLGIAAVVRIPQDKVPLDILSAPTGQRFQLSWSSIDDPSQIHLTEAQLQGFKRNTAGVAVTLKLHESDVSASLFMSAASSRWMIAWIKLNGSDEPVEGEVHAAGRKAEASAKALVKQRPFQIWCSREYGIADDEAGATHAVMEICGVEGLDEISLDYNAARSLMTMRSDFVASWKNS